LLSEGLSGSKSRSVSDHSASTADGAAPAARLPRLWLWGLVALTVTVMGLVVILAVVNPFDSTPRGHSTRPPSPRTQNTKSQPKSPQATDSGADGPKRISEAEPAIVVRTKGEDGKGIPASNLLEAIEKAMGSRGWVELQNREPLHLASDQILDLGSGQGLLIVRAAAGIEPVIEIELKGPKSLLTTGSGVKLILSGLTILVHYPQPGLAPSSAPPAVITAAGIASIDHCAFKVVGSPYLKDSRAIVSNGGALEVDHCWFEGFDKAIELSAVNRTPARIQQTMIVLAPGPAQGQPPELYGWGVKIQSTGSGSPHPHLILEHCTVEGAGLLDLTSSRVLVPLQVEINHCAIRTEALLACKPSKPGEPPTARFNWRGQGNQYDIREHFWIVLSASQGTPDTSVTDLDSWLRVATKESEPIRAKLKYQIDHAARPAALRPRDFAIDASGPPQTKPGADPDKVGPWNSP
jgi:eukaryotic-like serine/threonine-protein kinase